MPSVWQAVSHMKGLERYEIYSASVSAVLHCAGDPKAGLRAVPGYGPWENDYHVVRYQRIEVRALQVRKVLVIAPKKVAEATWTA